jgi:hypothetical protein
MKTFQVRLDDVECAMLSELRKVKSQYRDIQSMLAEMIREDYAKYAKIPKKTVINSR